MTRCVVEIYGLSSEITGLRKVEIDLEDRASLGDVIRALKQKVPALEGRVIHSGDDRLMEHYAFNINGRFYSEVDEAVRLQDGDRIALLTLAAGG